MEFDLRRSPLFFVIYVGMYIPIFIFVIIQVVLDAKTIGSEWVVLAGVFLVVIVLIYFISIRPYYAAKYVIKNGILLCQGSWYKPSIDINLMKTISKSSYPTSSIISGFALSKKGIKVNYGAGYTIFLTPLNQRAFIEALIKINPQIKYIGD